jgi:hypothetical protein
MPGFIKYLIEEMRALEHGEYIVRNDAGPIVSRDHFDLRSAEIAAAKIGGHTRVEPCLRVTEYTVEILNGMGWCPLGRYASLERPCGSTSSPRTSASSRRSPTR